MTFDRVIAKSLVRYVIEFHNVHKTYRVAGKDIPALHPTSLRVENGQVFGLIGHSGAGKSTLLRLINRLEEPSGGQIKVDDEEVTALDANGLRQDEHVDESEQRDDFAHVPGRIVRLTFQGEATYAPLLGTVARETGVDYSILAGRIDRIKDVPYGQLTLAVTGGDMEAAFARFTAADVHMEVFFANIDWFEIWLATGDTLLMLGGSLLFTVLLGLPLGVLLFLCSPRQLLEAKGVYAMLSLVVNILRSLPFIILLIVMIPFTVLITGTSLGVAGAIPPLVVGATPFFARLVETALREVDRGIIEATQAMGATTRQIITNALLPEARPGIFAAITVTAVTLVSYTAMAGVVGAGGLGDLAIRFGYQRFQTDVMVVTVVLLLVLVQVLQTVGDKLVFVKPALAQQGVDLKVKVFTDYIQPNVQVAEKRLDANFFQHQPYLDEFNKAKGTNLVSVAGVHLEPLGAYSSKYKTLEELPSTATVVIPNDATNGGRALLLLAKAGVIKLQDSNNILSTVKDITENPKNLKFRELEAATIPRVLTQVDLALINTNYALEAKLDPSKDALVIEGSDSPYVNILVARPDDKDSEAMKKLVAALHSPEVKAFILEKYKGAVVPAF
eukprot:gene6104-5966_t